jgi:hypothetical protein
MHHIAEKPKLNIQHKFLPTAELIQEQNKLQIE